MRKTPTIVDIARESGVSIATVSRVLNGSAPVAEATRARVSEVIRRHRYAPAGLAGKLKPVHGKSIGILMPDISNPYFSAMFREFQAAAHEAGYTVLLCNSSFRAENRREAESRELDYIRSLLERQVEGALVVGGQADLPEPSRAYREALAALSEALPVVVLGNAIEGLDCHFVQRERGQGIFSAVNCLSSLGHRRIAFLGGEDGVDITTARLEAYRLALETLRLDTDPGLVRLSDYYTNDGYAAAMALLESETDFTAILAMNDSVAMGVYRALADKGLRIPEDVSVISCDEFDWSEYFVPRLTSVNQHNELFGRFIINTLFGAMNGVQETVLLKHKPELMIRESCAPPRTRREG